MSMRVKNPAPVKGAEGLRLVAYLDTGGVPTIGWGHTKGVKLGDKITIEQAEQFLKEDLHDAEGSVNILVKVPLTQNQFDALVSFVYNIGGSQFKTSTLLRLLNKGDYKGAADQFKRWKYDNGVVVQGLLNRRMKEEELFLKE